MTLSRFSLCNSRLHAAPKASISLALALALALSGCSAADNASAQAPAAPASQRVSTDDASSKAMAAKAGACGLLNSDDIQQAFAGKLTVLRTSPHHGNDAACSWYLVEGREQENFISLGIGDTESFDFLKSQFVTPGKTPTKPIAIGREAYLVNGAEIIAIDQAGHSLRLAAQLIFFGEPSPISKEALAKGLEDLANLTLERRQT